MIYSDNQILCGENAYIKVDNQNREEIEFTKLSNYLKLKIYLFIKNYLFFSYK